MERFVPNFKVVPYWGSPNVIIFCYYFEKNFIDNLFKKIGTKNITTILGSKRYAY